MIYAALLNKLKRNAFLFLSCLVCIFGNFLMGRSRHSSKQIVRPRFTPWWGGQSLAGTRRWDSIQVCPREANILPLSTGEPRGRVMVYRRGFEPRPTGTRAQTPSSEAKALTSRLPLAGIDRTTRETNNSRSGCDSSVQSEHLAFSFVV